MARERSAVAGIVGGVVHRFDVRETGEIHKASAEDRRADGGGQALAQGGGGAGGRGGAADDRHGASLLGFRVHERMKPREPGTQGSEQRPPTAGLLSDFFGPVSGLARGFWP